MIRLRQLRLSAWLAPKFRPEIKKITKLRELHVSVLKGSNFICVNVMVLTNYYYYIFRSVKTIEMSTAAVVPPCSTISAASSALRAESDELNNWCEAQHVETTVLLVLPWSRVLFNSIIPIITQAGERKNACVPHLSW